MKVCVPECWYSNFSVQSTEFIIYTVCFLVVPDRYCEEQEKQTSALRVHSVLGKAHVCTETV